MSSKTIYLDDAVETLVDLYRQNLEDDPDFVAQEWQRQMEQHADAEWRDEDCVLLIAT